MVFVCLNGYYSNNNTNTSSSSSNFMHLFSYSHCVMLSFVLYTVDSESSDSDNQFSDNNDQLEGAHRNDNDSTVTDDKCQSSDCDASNSCDSGKYQSICVLATH